MSAIDYRVVPLGDQVIAVRVSGQAVGLFEPNVVAPVDDPDLVTPDPVAFLAQCVESGFFPSLDLARGPGAMRLLERVYDAGSMSQEWRIELINLDLAVLRVLMSMLQARRLDAISLWSTEDGPLLPATRPPAQFPALREPLDFVLDHPEPARPDRGRVLTVTLVREPSDDALQALYGLLEDWVTLLLLGGYPPDGVSATSAGVIPDLAALIDRTRVEQAFDEAFICHEDAFNPVIEGLQRYHRTRVPIVSVEIA